MYYTYFLNQDEARVNQRFCNAEKNGIAVQSRTVDLEELLQHINNNGLGIVLTDANMLDCQHCKSTASELGHKIKQFFMFTSPYSGRRTRDSLF